MIRSSRKIFALWGAVAYRVVVSLLLATSLMRPATAQGSSVGLEAGPTYAMWSGNAVDASGIWGVRFAAVLEGYIGSRWSVAVAGAWEQDGATRVRIVDMRADVKSSEIAFPLVIRYAVNVAPSWTLSPYAGVALVLAASCQIKDTMVFEFEEDCDDGPTGEPPAAGVDIPVGLRLMRTYQGGSRFVTSLEYQVGLTNRLPALAEAGGARNRTWVIATGFSLPLF